MKYGTKNVRYLPADELLDRPRFRVLRLMRRFDWISIPEICVALDDWHSHAAFWHALRLLAKEGLVDRRTDSLWLSSKQPQQIYRIAAAGRRHYDDLLARTLINEERSTTRRSA